MWTLRIPECPVCWDYFDDSTRIPRILRCGHTICESCLMNRPLESRLGQQCIDCPECHSPCLWRGVKEFPKNFILLRAMDKASSRQVGGSSTTSIISLEKNYLLNMFFDAEVISSCLHFVVIEGRRFRRMVRRKLWKVIRFFCLAALLVVLLLLSLLHAVLAWWVASLGFLLLIWFTAGGFGLGAFVLCLWLSYNITCIFLRLNMSLHRKIRDAQ